MDTSSGCRPHLLNLLEQSTLFREGFWLLLGDDYGGGFVVGIEVEEFYALGAAAYG